MTNPIIKPTVGRVVLFHPCERTGEASFIRHPDGQPYAAIIARVWSDDMVNLTVMDANGNPHSRTSVPLVQDGDSCPVNGFYCEWLPYQKGQAAKTEAAEKSAGTAINEPSQRERLEYALVPGAATYLAAHAHEAERIAEGVKKVLNKLHPQPSLLNPHTGTQRDSRDVASDPQAILCMKQGEPLKAAAIALPIIDPAPDPLETALLKVLSAVQRYLPPDGISIETAMSEIIEAVDPWPIGRTTMEPMEHPKGVAQFTKRPETIALPVIDPGQGALERAIQAQASSAPRVTPADIEAEIVSEHFFTASDAIQHENAVHEHKGDWFLGNTQLLTFCVIQLRNGFTVTGESACASPANFNAEIGRTIARENAVNKIWPLLGFRLRDVLAKSVA